MPSDFDIEMTDLFPGDATLLSAQPGDSCVVMLDKEPVITGYVDAWMPTLRKDAHSIRVRGRSKSADLVDCSAEWQSGQISGTSALDVAQKLAKPYGITVSSDVSPGPTIPQFNMIIGDSGFDIVERVCRYSGLIFYDKADGSIVLSQAGKTKAASGFTQGANIELATYALDSSQEFSEYDVFGLSMAILSDAGVQFNLVATSKDPNVKRHRLKYSVCESGGAGLDIAQKRADWEAARRLGRSRKLTVTTDGWRDQAGTLWTPNTIVTVDIPTFKLSKVSLCVSEVSFRRDGTGTHADLVLMPPSAFLPQPVILQPVLRDAVGPPAR